MARLEYIDNAGQKSVLNLATDQSVSIGRNPGSSIHTTNPSVSRNHGRIFFKAGTWLIKDLGSSNGTYVNDEPVQQADIGHEARIRCGDFVITFFDDTQDVPNTAQRREPRKRTRAKTRRAGAAPADLAREALDRAVLDRAALDRAALDGTLSGVPVAESPAGATLRPRANPTEAKLPRPSVEDVRRSRREEEQKRRAERAARRQARDGGDHDAPRPAASATPEDEATQRQRERDERERRRRERRKKEREERAGGSKKARPSRSSRSSGGRGEPSEREAQLVAQVKEQGAEIETLSSEIRDQRSMVSDLELKAEENQSRALRYEIELDSITEKYVQIKDQLTLSRERLDETREELAERDDQVFALERRIAELDTELEGARSRATDTAESTASFKIKLTQKDRQIEELQRQYDLMEFEFRAAKEELQALQEGYNQDSGETHKLERRINQLREIITDKENVISELRLEIENRDIELRQTRMGMGMSDLEDEKAKLLQDYYEKNRECDALRDSQRTLKHEQLELAARLGEVEAELERKSAQAADIQSHPDYKAKVREGKRLEERVDELQSELQLAEERLGAFTADDKKRLLGEVAFFKRKSRTLEDKLSKTQARGADLEAELETARAVIQNAPPPKPAGISDEELGEQLEKVMGDFKGKLEDDLEGVYEMFIQWRSNFSLFKTYLKDVSAAVEGLGGDDKDAADEAMESVHDLLRVVDSDATALKRGLNNFKKKIG